MFLHGFTKGYVGVNRCGMIYSIGLVELVDGEGVMSSWRYNVFG